MKCPNILSPVTFLSGQISNEPEECLKQECALYNQAEGKCAHLLLSESLLGIEAIMKDIVEVMQWEKGNAWNKK